MRAGAMLVLGVMTTAATGCVLGPDSDASRFREAIPQSEAIVVSGPDSVQDSQASGTQSYDGLSSAQSNDEPWANGPWAYWYGFTRHVRHGVNKVSASVLGSVWIIVNTRPTSVSEDEAVWGPWSDALEPVIYRFRVTEVGPREYDYVLEGKPKSAGDSGQYIAVLSGKGWGRGHEKHGDGHFSIDLDAAQGLDPFGHDPEDTGVVTIEHDLPPTITQDLFKGRRWVKATVKPSHTPENWSAASTTEEDGSGTLVVDAFADVEDENNTAPENISVRSRWKTTGAGRSDITITDGDVPVEIGTIKATECWDNKFQSVYIGYSHNVTWETPEGEPSACVFGEPG